MDHVTETKIFYATDLLVRWLSARTRDVSNLEHADRLFVTALIACPDGDGRLATHYRNHSYVLFELFKATSDSAILERAIARVHEALEHTAVAKPDEPVITSPGNDDATATISALLTAVVPAFGGRRMDALIMGYGEPEPVASPALDVDAVEGVIRAALAIGSTGQLRTAISYIVLAQGLHLRFRLNGDIADLDAAIEAAEAGVAAAPPTGAVRVAGLLLCAATRGTRWRSTGQTTDLAAAVDLRKAAQSAKPAAHQLEELHAGLCAALRDRFEHLNDPADLAGAVAAGRIAVRAGSWHPTRRARNLANLSAAYRTRFESARRRKDLTRAVGSARAAVDVCEVGDPERPRYLGTLTLVLLCDFKARRQLESVTEAIQAGRAALKLTEPVNHPLRPALLANAANALRERYEWSGDLADLNETIVLVRESIEITESGHPARFRRRAGLCAALLRRFESTGVRADIDEAVREARAAFDDAPVGHPQRPGMRVNEGLALYRRFETYGSARDLDDCIDAYRAAVDDSRTTSSQPHPWTYQLSAPLRERYLLTGNETDLAEALATAAAGAREAADGGAWFNLGMALHLCHEKEGLAGEDRGSGRAAEGAFAQCAKTAGTSALIRASAALRLGRLSGAREDWKTANVAYGIALAELPRLAGRHLGWDSRQRQLARFAGLGTDAAAVAVELRDPERAVTILEQTRGILLGQALDHTLDVEAVRRADKDLADEFTRLSELLTADTAASTEFDADPVTLADPAAGRRDIATRWSAVVDQIRRTVPGQERFLMPPEIGDLLQTPADGAVVIVNASQHRCDALIIHGGEVKVERLPNTVWHEGRRLSKQLTAAGDDQTNEVVTRAMSWLAANITEAVLKRIRPGVSRIWWMPTGELSALPLPASASWRVGGYTGTERIESSITTTLRALAHSLALPAENPDSGKLIVAMSKTAGQKRLPRAAAEATKVAARLGPPTETVSDEDADPRAVLAKLRYALLVHFACHAISNLADPASSAILLAQGRLSVRDIAALPRLNRYLVYLSACTTALSGGLLADEAMHLASAFQLIGFRAVIGTLWKVDDDVARDVADDFYRLLRDGHEPATALHEAVDVVRSRYPDNPALWAGFVHFGS